MYNVCLRYMRYNEDAEDTLSIGFAKVFDRIRNFHYQENNSLKAWIRKIMINECLMKLRRQESLSLVSEDEFPETVIADQKLEQMDAQYILNAIRELPAGYRTVLNMFAIEGFSHAEIADILGVSEGTSRSQLNKARKLIRQKLAIHDQTYAKKEI